jgi:hypothetical protein
VGDSLFEKRPSQYRFSKMPLRGDWIAAGAAAVTTAGSMIGRAVDIVWDPSLRTFLRPRVSLNFPRNWWPSLRVVAGR